MQRVLSKRAPAAKNLSSSNGQLPALHHRRKGVKNKAKLRRRFTFSSLILSSRVQIIMMAISCFATALYLTHRIYHNGALQSSYSYFRGLRTSNHNQLIDTCQRQQKQQQRNNAKQRWSEQFRNKSKVRSMFNCDAKGALCQYYYPSNFFDEECGLGESFIL